jgi:hypothetical protein
MAKRKHEDRQDLLFNILDVHARLVEHGWQLVNLMVSLPFDEDDDTPGDKLGDELLLCYRNGDLQFQFGFFSGRAYVGGEHELTDAKFKRLVRDRVVPDLHSEPTLPDTPG